MVVRGGRGGVGLGLAPQDFLADRALLGEHLSALVAQFDVVEAEPVEKQDGGHVLGLLVGLDRALHLRLLEPLAFRRLDVAGLALEVARSGLSEAEVDGRAELRVS